MPYNSTYANETDFLEWYRNRYGKEYTGENFVKPDTMSDDDYEIGKSLYSSYLNSQKRASEYEGSKTDIERAYGSQVEQAGNDKNYATNVANQQADSSLSKLEQYYGTAVNALDKSKRQSQQNASIALDKLKKYLPTQIKAQGLGGLGVSESTMLKAYNNYNSDMGAIESDYQQNKTTLETNYADNKRGIESERDTAINAAEKSYNDSVARLGESKAQSLSELERAYNSANDNANIEAQANAQGVLDKYKTRFTENRKTTYEDMYSTLSKSNSSSESELLNFVEGFKKQYGVDDETALSQYNTLVQHAKQVAQANAQYEQDKDYERKTAERENAFIVAQSVVEELIADGKYTEAQKYLDDNKDIFGESGYNSYKTAIDVKNAKQQEETQKKEQEEYDQRVLEGKEYVKAPNSGKTYKITSKLSQDANQIKRNNDFKDKLNKLGFTNPYDSNIPNGTTLEVKGDNNGSNDFNFWDDIGAFLVTPLGHGAWDSWGNNKTYNMTFYNGEWYLSEKK